MISHPHSWKRPDLWTCLYFLGHGIIHILDFHVFTTLKFQKQMWQYRFFQRRVKGGRGSVNINMSDLRLILISSLCALGRGVERHGEVPVGVLWPGISCPVRIMPATEPAGPVESSRNPHCSMLSAHTSSVILASHLSDPKKAWANKLFLYPKGRVSGAHQS